MPGRASETYLKPADSAASLGSTMVSMSAAGSAKATLLVPPKMNRRGGCGFQSVRLRPVPPQGQRIDGEANASLAAGTAAPIRGRGTLQTSREPAGRRTRLNQWNRREGMMARDAIVLAKLVFLTFGLGLTGMIVQMVMAG